MNEQEVKDSNELERAEWGTPSLQSLELTQTEGGKALSPFEFGGVTGPS